MNYPTFEITTPCFPISLTVSAENFETLDLTNVEGEVPASADSLRDLGVIDLTPNGPLLHYRISYHDNGKTELFDLSKEIAGTYTLYNVTQDRNVTPYMIFDAGTFITITNDAAAPGDVLRLTLDPEKVTQQYTIEPLEFVVPWANGSGEIQATRLTVGRIIVTDHSWYGILFDSEYNLVKSGKSVYSVLPGTYRLVGFNDNMGNITITEYSQISSLGLSEDSFFETEITVTSGEDVETAIPSLKYVPIPTSKVSASHDKKRASGICIPVTVNYSFDPSLADVEKRIEIVYYKSSTYPLFLQSGGKYAWSVGDTLIGNSGVSFVGSSIGNYVLTIHVDSLEGSVVFYAYQDTTYYIYLNAGVYSLKSTSVRTPVLDGDISYWTVSALPSRISAGDDKVRLDVYHPRLVVPYYFRAYKNGKLIEKTPGCGYTELINDKNAGNVTVWLPAENLADMLNVVTYDFTVSTCAEDPATFILGTILLGEDATASREASEKRLIS